MNLAGDSANPKVPAVSAVHSTTGRGVAASSAQGIALEATATTDTAVFAHSNTGRGVDGRSNGAEGVHGESNSSAAGVVGINFTGGDGVFGSCTSPGGTGIHGQGSFNGGLFEGGGFGVHAIAGPDNGDTAVFAEGHAGNLGIFASGDQAGFFAGAVVVNGDLSVSGTKSAIVPFPDGSHRRLYCLESPESWFEDFGFAHLTDGHARIHLDPDFVTAVHTDEYHVFITEYDDHNGLFVTHRTNTGFEVRAKTSARDSTFSYRVVARRKDIVAARLAKLTLPTAGLEKIKARLAKLGREPHSVTGLV